MLLAINVGNSTTRFGLLEEGSMLASVQVSTDRNRSSTELAALAAAGFATKGVPDALGSVRAVCVSSVVPTLNPVVSDLIERFLQGGAAPLWVTSALMVDMPVRYEPMGSLGADRFVNAYAARGLYGGPVIVVDFGTATAFEAVDADGAYRGGAIAPGVGTGRDALAERTAQLSRVDLDVAGPLSAIGTSTNGAMVSGLLLGAAALLEGMIERFRTELGAPRAPVVATGGLAAIVARYTDVISHLEPDLTLLGLGILYEKAQGQ
jgi:type III pantothenate kinase